MISVFLLLSILNFQATELNTTIIQGAWANESGVVIFSGAHFSYTAFDEEAFHFTVGGSFTIKDNQIELNYEFHTSDNSKVGTKELMDYSHSLEQLTIFGQEFTVHDEGTNSDLTGAWLFSNRKRNGELGEPRDPSNPRKTMKILSGKRFQWVAYNVETKEFSGTGGGTYTALDGVYTENIEFFSRDQSRVGASLSFSYDVHDGDWHHSGSSSTGEAMYEIWTRR